MIYIGIDQSLTNFAVTVLDYCNEEIHLRKITSENTGVRRLRDIWAGLHGLLDELPRPVGAICMEGYASGARFGREAMGECGALTKLALVEYFGEESQLGFPYIVAPVQVKKFAGDSKAKKDDIKLNVYKKWGVEIHDHDLADAYVLSRIAEALYTGITKHQYEADVVAKVRGQTEWQTKLSSRRGTKKTSSG